MENENDPFNSIILDESDGEEKSERKPRFINCARCGKKIRNTPEKVSGHERYCRRKTAEKTSDKTSKPATVKPVIEKEKITVKPANIKTEQLRKTPLVIDKGFKFSAADAILLGGLVFTGLLFISTIKPARPAETPATPTAAVEAAPAQKAEPAQPVTPIAPPYPYYR